MIIVDHVFCLLPVNSTITSTSLGFPFSSWKSIGVFGSHNNIVVDGGIYPVPTHHVTTSHVAISHVIISPVMGLVNPVAVSHVAISGNHVPVTHDGVAIPDAYSGNIIIPVKSFPLDLTITHVGNFTSMCFFLDLSTVDCNNFPFDLEKSSAFSPTKVSLEISESEPVHFIKFHSTIIVFAISSSELPEIGNTTTSPVFVGENNNSISS
jgi:hypothetical protein